MSGGDVVFKTRQQYEDEDTERFWKKKADTNRRRMAKIESEGFKCNREGCNKRFSERSQLNDHINQHIETNKKYMICDQLKCNGIKFDNRRAYNQHIDKHKEEARSKFKNILRSILLPNKFGLVLDEFESEYKYQTGKQVPYKLMGFNCSYDLLVNMTDVVKIVVTLQHISSRQRLNYYFILFDDLL